MGGAAFWADYVKGRVLFDTANSTETTFANVYAVATAYAATSLTTDVTGDLTGDVTGNVTGDLTGNVTGDVTGDVTGNVTGDVTGDLTGNVTGDVTGDITGDVTGNLTGLAIQGATANAATSGAVAIPITELYSGYTTNATAAIAATLADGAVGQEKWIKLETLDTNNMVVTPANFNNGSTITFDATGEVAHLIFVGTGWEVLYTNATVA